MLQASLTVLHKRQGQSGSHCLILDVIVLPLFMALGTKDHTLGAK